MSISNNSIFTKRQFIRFLVLLFVLLAGIINLNQHFNGDQALFAVYAAAIDKGAVLYRDVWDIKQPGIFVFYFLSGKIFGFTETGIHLFELIYWLAFSLILQTTLRKFFRHELFAQIAPLLTIGIYYAVCQSFHLTQVEGLIGFPLYLTLWTAIQSFPTKDKKISFRWAFISGICGGAVLLFKLILLPIILLFWLIPAFYLNRFDVKVSEIFRAFFLPIFIGALILPIVGLIYFVWQGVLPIVFYTYFQFPSEAVLAIPAENRTSILKDGIYWFLANFKSLLIISAVGSVLKIFSTKCKLEKSTSPETVEKRIFFFGLIIWMVAGCGAILLQKLSWWQYHYLLLFVPLGILTLKSIEIIYEKLADSKDFFTRRTGKIILSGFLLMLFIPNLKQLVIKAKNYAVGDAKTSSVYKGSFDERYEIIKTETESLASDENRDKIFVLGHPLYYYLSKRLPAIETNGWMPEFFLPLQWQKMETEIKTTKPKYIFIERSLNEKLLQNAPQVPEILNELYFLKSRGENTDLYELSGK